MSFRDHFSAVAGQYAASRPVYPVELAERLAAVVPTRPHRRAWDAGCGSGQLSTLLAEVFAEVDATDASPQQIAAARPHPRVRYRVAPAEASGLPDASIDLCVAAQAAHWFDLDRYYAEVRRVAVPDGVIALVTYSRPSLDADLQPALERLYGVVDPYWPPERKPVDELYAHFPFPFDAVPFPRLRMQLEWPLEHLLGYADTWSSTQGLVKARGREALDEAVRPLREAWGDPAIARTVVWAIAARVGRAHGAEPRRAPDAGAATAARSSPP